MIIYVTCTLHDKICHMYIVHYMMPHVHYMIIYATCTLHDNMCHVVISIPTPNKCYHRLDCCCKLIVGLWRTGSEVNWNRTLHGFSKSRSSSGDDFGFGSAGVHQWSVQVLSAAFLLSKVQLPVGLRGIDEKPETEYCSGFSDPVRRTIREEWAGIVTGSPLSQGLPVANVAHHNWLPTKRQGNKPARHGGRRSLLTLPLLAQNEFNNR